ncbi:MAG: sulfotransferase [Phycisphaerales bacterium]|nr:sulfotransferase [Phycisphaerales bacterium]
MPSHQRPSTPDNSIKARRDQAIKHLDHEMYGLATEEGERLVTEHPGRFDGWYVLARVAQDTAAFTQGLKYAKKALELSPIEEAELHRLVIVLATMSGDTVEAEAALDRMDRRADKIRALGAYPGAREELRARLYERCGRLEEGLEVIRRAGREGASHSIVALVEGRCLSRLGRTGEAIEVATRLMDDASASHVDRSHSAFLLSKIHDKAGEYDTAWAMAQRGHELFGAKFSRTKFDGVIDSDTTPFTKAKLNMWQRPSNSGSQAIMINAIARSGTSLLEQILSMHPSVYPGGESGTTLEFRRQMQSLLDSYHTYPTCFIDMTQQEADGLQEKYFQSILPDGAKETHTTDKALGLFHRLGLISVLFPGARIINLRRHPLDNLLSCYLTQLVTSGHSYCSNLEDLAHFWKTKERVSAWSKEMFELEWLDLSYEQLTHDQEGWTRRLIDHAGLPWDDACLQFHTSKRSVATISYEQVQKKMYTSSVERWRNYEKHLQPLIKALGKGLDEYDPGI